MRAPRIPPACRRPSAARAVAGWRACGAAARRRRVRDLLDEALAGVAARPTRLILTTLGTVLGIAALVGTVGLGQTASGQITQRFDLAAATRVVVQPGETRRQEGEAATQLPWDAPERVERLNGVERPARSAARRRGRPGAQRRGAGRRAGRHDAAR